MIKVRTYTEKITQLNKIYFVKSQKNKKGQIQRKRGRKNKGRMEKTEIYSKTEIAISRQIRIYFNLK